MDDEGRTRAELFLCPYSLVEAIFHLAPTEGFAPRAPFLSPAGLPLLSVLANRPETVPKKGKLRSRTNFITQMRQTRGKRERRVSLCHSNRRMECLPRRKRSVATRNAKCVSQPCALPRLGQPLSRSGNVKPQRNL